MKKYGIYLAFPPTIDIRAEGLGRYLAAFLKASQSEHEAHFIIGCPSWSYESLQLLCKGEGIDFSRLEFLSPKGLPALLRLFFIIDFFKPTNTSRLSAYLRRLLKLGAHTPKDSTGMVWLRWLVASPSYIAFILLSVGAVLLLPLILVAIVVLSAKKIGNFIAYQLIKPRINKQKLVQTLAQRPNLAVNLKDYDLVLFFYKLIQEDQSRKLVNLINKRKDVAAWYAPAAFWNEFGSIEAPNLMCVPDVVLKDFPVGFSSVGGNRFAETVRKIGKAIQSADYLVTYSDHIKWENVVKYYARSPEHIFVVPHAPNTLSQWLPVNSDDLATKKNSKELRDLLASALTKSLDPAYLQGASPDFSFLFYASQIRPNKNVLTLLRAYEYLLRHDYMPHKLILTGNPYGLPAVARFIEEHQLQKDVLFLHGLSTAELATCYAMADLAVNPSLSEGGCPFTFTEALSVGTPAVTARIPVALEVLTDESLQDTTFFDPYDWKDLVKRIKWALAHREELLAIQKPIYQELTKRTWQDVVNDHINILEKIANQNADQSARALCESKSS